jgi:arylsulfatase A-like enzyme
MKQLIKFIIFSIILTSCSSKEPLQRPNIVFILVDDLGFKDLSFTGSTFYETPNIDKLASNSFVFTQGYACSRVCSPSRASIMTGKFTARHGVTDWIGAATGTDWRKKNRQDKLLPAEYIHNLPKEDITLAEAMKANGYKTFFAGKWHLGSDGSYPEDHGFDINKGGWRSGSPKGGYFSPYKNPKLENTYNGENLSMRLANETVDFIKQNKDKPFFAFLSFYAVHGPIQTTQDKWHKYQQKAAVEDLKENGFIMERKLPIRQTQDNPVYAGLVESMDDAVGTVLKALENLNLENNTIVVFTSDNGGVASGDAFSTSNLPLRGGKGYQWEAGIREPYFIYVPGQNTKGKQSDYPVTGADFYPTLLDFANIELLNTQHKDGISLRPIIIEGKTPQQRPLYWHYPHYGNQGGDPSSIIREGKWKLIYYYEDETQELYDLSIDPYEQNNVANNFPEVKRKLSLQLKSYLVEVNAHYPEKDNQFDPDKRTKYEERIKNQLLPKLEKERFNMLSDDFQPNENWWGSKTTKD